MTWRPHNDDYSLRDREKPLDRISISTKFCNLCVDDVSINFTIFGVFSFLFIVLLSSSSHILIKILIFKAVYRYTQHIVCECFCQFKQFRHAEEK